MRPAPVRSGYLTRPPCPLPSPRRPRHYRRHIRSPFTRWEELGMRVPLRLSAFERGEFWGSPVDLSGKKKNTLFSGRVAWWIPSSSGVPSSCVASSREKPGWNTFIHGENWNGRKRLWREPRASCRYRPPGGVIPTPTRSR